MKFHKYHALGNDYIVIEPRDCQKPLTTECIRTICHRHFGVGSDGILFGPVPAKEAKCALKIFNPDGSEAEKSGNGLRIFSRFLYDQERVAADEEFEIETKGGMVKSTVFKGGQKVRVEMGRVSFNAREIPVAGDDRVVINEKIKAGDREFTYCAATIGNPHCVILVPEAAAELAREYGPSLEIHENFPNRTNVQFMQVIDRQNIRIEIWERGAGYTLASGSSSSASAAVARKLGLVDKAVTVHMPGGELQIEIGEDYSILMTGGVTRVAGGEIHREMFDVKP
ncbi:MAG TPA: diaminopimelate epimerase [Verrucomicrobiales bacterium]|nr:diaminopimelate epimerase [Verrucomicrobiales bacterium]